MNIQKQQWIFGSDWLETEKLRYKGARLVAFGGDSDSVFIRG